MRKISVLMFFCVVAISCLHAQTNTFPSTGAAGIGTLTPNASSLLDIVSTTKGILIPRMTKAQRDLIASPVTGLLIYQTNNTPGFYYYSGTAWTAISKKGATTTLNNLVSPTAINQALLPQSGGTLDFGSSLLPWKDIYFSGNLYTLSGRVFSAGPSNTATGLSSLLLNTSGFYNTANGAYTLQSNTTGAYNTASGIGTLQNNTVGNSNTANGVFALVNNTTGYSNVAIGASALYGNQAGSNLVAVGDSALYNNTGVYNTAIGSKTLYSNTTGNWNTANGFHALFNNKTGSYNTANGGDALFWNNDGWGNTANGYGALGGNTTGGNNTGIGANALGYNKTGSFNTATGQSALLLDTAGSYNTANGFSALYNNTTGYSNVAVGTSSLYSNTTSSNLVAVGDSALYKNTAGYNTAVGSKTLYNNTIGNYNTANGYQALYSNLDGITNTANGYQALYSNTAGNDNTANGYRALNSTNTGYSNTANGSYALASNTTGHGNTALGASADVSTGALFNAMALGSGAIVDTSNKVRIGNTSVTRIGGQVSWTTFSDGRYKKNIKEDVKGLSFINNLRPITYTVDIKSLNAYYEKGRKHDDDYEKMKAEMQPSVDEASKIVYNGFIAQDVEAAAKKLNYAFSGVDKPGNKDGLYGLRYSDFVVPLVKAVQELSKQNDSLKNIVDPIQNENLQLKSTVNDLQKQFNDLKTLVLSIQQCSPCNTSGATSQTYNTTITDGAALEQNVPNPFMHATTIGYTLPQKFTTAQIMITDKTGKSLKLVNVSGAGKGQVNVDASVLASGAYNYSLLVDGKLIGTKQMILAK